MYRRGLALDIDETLSWTVGCWIGWLQEKFGNPENLTIEEIVAKYRYTQMVPYWQTPECLAWMEEHRRLNHVQELIDPVPEALESVIEIQKIIPISVYITMRPVTVLEGTINWLKKFGFPDRPVIARPLEVEFGEETLLWKARKLESLHPGVVGMIDDSAEVLNYVSPNYSGKFYLYDHEVCPVNHHWAKACKTWQKVVEEIKKDFSITA